MDENMILGTAGDDVLSGVVMGIELVTTTTTTETVTRVTGGNGAENRNGKNDHNSVKEHTETVTVTTITEVEVETAVNQVIEAGAGNDVLTGGKGNDTLVLRFNIQDYVIDSGRVDLSSTFTLDGVTYTRPSANAATPAWQNYTNAYNQFVAEQQASVAGDGVAFDFDTMSVTTKTAGKNLSQTFDLATGFDWEQHQDQITGQGADQITDFGNGDDMLALAGLSDDASAINYWANWLTSFVDNAGNTVIHSKGAVHAGGEFQITLMGVQTSLAELVQDGKVSWGDTLV